MICPDCKTEMVLHSTIYNWKDNKPLFCLEEQRCPECRTKVGTRVIVETYKRRDK